MKRRPNILAVLTCTAPGLEHFRELIAAADAGRAPAPETVAALAEAARQHLFTNGKARERLEHFGRELGMFRKQGKGKEPDRTAGTYAARIGPVGFVLQAERRRLAEGSTPSAARAAALVEVAERTGTPKPTLARWVREMRADAVAKLADAEREHAEMTERALREFDQLQRIAKPD